MNKTEMVEKVAEDFRKAATAGMLPATSSPPLFKTMAEIAVKTLLQHVEQMVFSPHGEHIDVVFDGPPGHTAGRFVEVEDPSGASVGVGEWIERRNGMWALRLPTTTAAVERGEDR